MNEEQINAARAAYQRDPETACQAMLGCSSEELFVEALRGCNQHGHKQGCPEAEGGGGWLNKSTEDKLKAALKTQKKAKEKAENNYSKENRGFLNAATAQVNKYKKQIAASVVEKSDSMYNDIYRAWMNKGTDFLRKAGVNIADVAAEYSGARGAALFVQNNPSSDRWHEALKDMQKHGAALEDMYKKVKETKE